MRGFVGAGIPPSEFRSGCVNKTAYLKGRTDSPWIWLELDFTNLDVGESGDVKDTVCLHGQIYSV